MECSGPCRFCNSTGTCTSRPAFVDPENGCGNYTCNGAGACFTGCGGAACSPECKPAAFCAAGGTCTVDRNGGAACDNACQCKSNTCLLLLCSG
jgi:hypothetical protein